eukprot:SM000129S26144  [mRNA]  locus=s129:232819:233031:+ [translate_table: standard]
MRLAVSLQRPMARALHLAAASGSGLATHFQEPSVSDLKKEKKKWHSQWGQGLRKASPKRIDKDLEGPISD